MTRHPILAHFLQVIGQTAPLSLADRSWDNVGLLLESPTVRTLPSGVCRVLLTIDLTEAVYEEALTLQAAIILSYHPPWFRGEKSLTLDRERGVMRVVALCAAAGISIYSPHSALDALPEGINTSVGRVLGGDSGVASIVPITPITPAPPGVADCGMGRLVTLRSSVPLREMLARWTRHVGIPSLRLALPHGWSLDSPINRIAICVGSGASVLNGVSADLYFTGEMSHHEVLRATSAHGAAVALTEHSNCERGYLRDVFSPLLLQRLNEPTGVAPFELVYSAIDRDPISIFTP